MTYDETLSRIAGFVRTTLLGGSDELRIENSTPLLEWGVLNSMNTAKLLTFIREDLGTAVPPTFITGKHFRNLTTITEMVMSLVTAAA